MKNFGSKQFSKRVKLDMTSNKKLATMFRLSSTKVSQENNSTYQWWLEKGLAFHRLVVGATLSCLNLIPEDQFHQQNYCKIIQVRESIVQKIVQKPNWKALQSSKDITDMSLSTKILIFHLTKRSLTMTAWSSSIQQMP